MTIRMRSFHFERPLDEGIPLLSVVSAQGVEFGNGVIEAEIAGAPAPGAAEGARGFVGKGFDLDELVDQAKTILPT